MALQDRKPAPKKAPRSLGKPPTLKVDPERFPNVHANPSLERALRIRQALDQGKPRDEAVALADAAMGPRKLMAAPRAKKAGRPAGGPRPGGAAQHARRKPAMPGPPSLQRSKGRR